MQFSMSDGAIEQNMLEHDQDSRQTQVWKNPFQHLHHANERAERAESEHKSPYLGQDTDQNRCHGTDP